MQGFKAMADIWAKGAKEELVSLERKVKDLQADIRLAQETHARLSEELARYEAKKESL